MFTRELIELNAGRGDYRREIAEAAAYAAWQDHLRSGHPMKLGSHPSPMMQGGGVDPNRKVLFVRMTLTQSNDQTNFSLSQLTAHTALGGADILQGSGAAVTATSVFDPTNHPPSHLIDGNDATYCATGGSAGVKDFMVDLTGITTMPIVEVGLKPRTDGLYGQFPASVQIGHGPDTSTFNLDWTCSHLPVHFNSGGSANLLKIRAPADAPATAPNHRFWGIRSNAAAATPHEFGKLELRATLGGAQMMVATAGQMALARTPFNTGFPPIVGADGSLNQFAFGFSFSTGGLWLWDFGEGNEKPKPAQIALRASGIPSRCMTDFDLFYLDALGQAPTVQQNFTTPATWAGSEVRLFTVT